MKVLPRGQRSSAMRTEHKKGRSMVLHLVKKRDLRRVYMLWAPWLVYMRDFLMVDNLVRQTAGKSVRLMAFESKMASLLEQKTACKLVVSWEQWLD